MKRLSLVLVTTVLMISAGNLSAQQKANPLDKVDQLQEQYNQLQEKADQSEISLDSLEAVLFNEQGAEKDARLQLKELEKTANALEKEFQPSIDKLNKAIEQSRDPEERASLREERKIAQDDYRAQNKDLQTQIRETNKNIQSAVSTQARVKGQIGGLKKSIKTMRKDLTKLDKAIAKAYKY